ncbi:MAG: phnA protein [Pseudomonadota bacterium]
MARGYDQHRQRQEATALLGRPLARRSRSRCELCEAGQVRLVPFEVAPIPEDPDPDHAAMLCPACLSGALGARLDPVASRHLERACWSEVPAVQVLAVRLLRRLAAERVGWAVEALDGLYLDPEIEEWIG